MSCTKEDLINVLQPLISQYKPVRVYIVGSNRLNVQNDNSDWDIKFIIEDNIKLSSLHMVVDGTNIDVLITKEIPFGFWYYADYMLINDTEFIYGLRPEVLTSPLEAFKKCYQIVEGAFISYLNDGMNTFNLGANLIHLLYFMNKTTNNISCEELKMLRHCKDKETLKVYILKLVNYYKGI